MLSLLEYNEENTSSLNLISGLIYALSIDISITNKISLGLFAGDYTLENIQNAVYSRAVFKPIKCDSNSFEPFYPREKEGATNISLSFPIKQEYLESDNVMVLAIDAWNHVERRVFLITRPNNY